ncbi:hypothetical protein [Mycolicibacterium stellerae]|uniref:hypothetical protein n=1 Tax=Mycolicibacterium stellerae TaxID=2358193 RepID=UPI000F0AFC38|nr:hypothetical protein [Mycolicibacterium stellerae]
MAEPLDVTARLGDGRPAVETVGEYVWACHLVGYQNPDLTLHAAQVRDWYGSEDGLDLRALDADRAALDAAAAAADSAQRVQQQQLGPLAGAWQGRGGDASREFLVRHVEASAAVASAVRNAADALAALRDELWHAVDDKVGAAVAIEERRQTERAEWLAATRTVTTGSGDRAMASELIDQRVKPFVDNDIRSDWLTAMQKAMAAVSTAFDDATSILTDAPAAPFEVPGDLGPVSMPSSPASAPVAEVAGTVPAASMGPLPAAIAQGLGPTAAPAPALAAAPEPLAASMPAAPALATPPPSVPPAMPSTPPLGELGGGLPGAAGGLAGLGSQLADTIGGLVNRPDDALPDPAPLEDNAIGEDEPGTDDEKSVVDEDGEDESDSETDDLTEVDDPAAEPVDVCSDDPVDDVASPDSAPTPPQAPMPPPTQPIVDPPPNAEAVGAETPCEIAADELPQAGP